MTYTGQNFSAFLSFLEGHPEKRDVLYRTLLASSIIEKNINEIVEIQKQTEHRIGELTAAQERTEQRVDELAQAQTRTEKTVQELRTDTDRRFQEMAEAIASLAKSTQINFNRVDGRLGNIEGMLLEDRYRQRPAAYFGRIVRKASVLTNTELASMLEGKLSKDELNEVLWIDLVLHGTPQTLEIPEVWLAVEVSNVLDESDIERAEARATLLRRAGYPTIAVAAGEQISEQAKKTAEERKVVVLQDGSVFNLDAARV